MNAHVVAACVGQQDDHWDNKALGTPYRENISEDEKVILPAKLGIRYHLVSQQNRFWGTADSLLAKLYTRWDTL